MGIPPPLFLLDFSPSQTYPAPCLSPLLYNGRRGASVNEPRSKNCTIFILQYCAIVLTVLLCKKAEAPKIVKDVYCQTALVWRRLFRNFPWRSEKRDGGVWRVSKTNFPGGFGRASLIRACADTEGKLKFYYEMRHSEVPTRFPNALIFYFLLAVI